MKKNQLSRRNGSIHLYDPKKEGLGTYDIHYMNAYKKNKNLKVLKNPNTIKRYAA